PGENVVLPVFYRQQVGRDGAAHRSEVAPLEPFAAATTLALATLSPDPDGVLRRMSTTEGWRGAMAPSLAGAMAPDPGAQPRAFYVDFGIVPGSIPRISYADLADGAVPPEAVAGR